MWSEKYYYLNMYKSASSLDEVSTSKLKEFIAAISGLEQNGDFEYKNKESFPFVNLTLLNVKSVDSWSGNDTDVESTNLISIVCAKTEYEDFQKLKKVFIEIASFLQWVIVDEETDSGVENFVIWKP